MFNILVGKKIVELSFIRFLSEVAFIYIMSGDDAWDIEGILLPSCKDHNMSRFYALGCRYFYGNLSFLFSIFLSPRILDPVDAEIAFG